MKHPYIQLFAKLLLFFVVTVLVDVIIGVGFRYLGDVAYDNNTFSDEMNSRYCIEEASPDIAIIGSSTANHHYIPSMIEDNLGLTVYNFGKDGSFLYYQCALIDLMIDRYTPMVIIWEVGESSLSSNYNDTYEYQNMKNLYPWYDNPSVKHIIDKKDNFQKIRMLSCCYVYNSQLLTCLRLCFGKKYKENKAKGYIPLFSNNSAYPNKPQENQYKEYYLIPEKLLILKQTIDHCKQKGIKIIFTSSPRYYYDYVKHTYYYQKLREFAQNNNIPFLDYYNAEPFCKDSTLFRDNSHMNFKGAELYMNMFIPELRRIIKDSTLIKY